MKNLLWSLVGLVLMVPAQAQEKAPRDAEQQAAALRQRMGEVERGLQGVRQRLGLVPSKGGTVQDAEIAKLYASSESARKAVEAKVQDVLKGNPDGARIVAQIDEARNKIVELQKQLQELEKSLGPVRQRLGLAGPGKKGRGDAAVGAVPENTNVAALRQTAEAARKALEDKVVERLKADPEGAKLLTEREQIKAQTAELPKRQGK